MDMKMANESGSQAAEKERGQSCALCRELPGSVGIADAEGKQLRICLICDRLMQWH
jgi:hypothetical protein